MIAINIEMPKSCYDCDRKRHCEVGINGGWRTDIRVEGCPLVEIVTCKDCKHNKNGVCPNYRHFVDDDFYCKDAERRE